MSAQELGPNPSVSLSNNEFEGAFPVVLTRADKAACIAAVEFFSVRFPNAHTWTAYAH